ncbi:DUF3426 domain-containing protein [Chelatococcus sp. SYSU_G07232]|uniref:DUF3426 domain-containing protein n=1 Tax=Chelatococcus albus TaxID=3047466 RepID=A0ABT7AEA9_9HYPH|nr:DUF3426 domain-containing protein [Chelatococcus sp. SYSU_G07232]MDJ1157435.1 DUF3426 domain-containing protein [Chelatococcus sp. SYSU_G07232]
MLIVCPSCASSYTIDAEHLAPAGRVVRCAACRREWFVEPDGSVGGFPAEMAASGPGAAPSPQSTAAALSRGRRDARSGERAGRPAAPARLARAGAPLALAGFLAVFAALVIGRETVVRHLPETAALYARVGLPVNLRGLAFRNVRSETVVEGREGVLVVEGEVENVARRTVAVPDIAVVVRSPQGQPLYTWTSRPPRAALAPGERLVFRTRLAAPPEEGRDVLVRFAAGDDRLAEAASAL